MAEEISQIASEIQKRIALLCDFEGDNLKNEMVELKKALLENPAACELLLPEDIGMAVAALKRIVGVAQINASKPKTKEKKEKSKPMNAAELAAALEDEDF